MPALLFIMKYPLHKRENLKAKFDGQMEAVRTLGWRAYYIGWNEQGMYLCGEDTRELLIKTKLGGMRGYDHTGIFTDLMKAAEEAVRRFDFDAVYLRYMPTFPKALHTVNSLKQKGIRLVVEYPTYPIAQENERFFIRRHVFRYTDRIMTKINPMVDLYTLIGDPCGGSLHGRPAMNIVNGVNVKSFARHQPNSDTHGVRLLALASMSGWHGYDRIIRSLSTYRGDTEVWIDFVGGDGDGSLAQWKLLADELHVETHVTFHGPRYGDDLEAIIAQSDLGVGSLGMFRYGLQQGMTLKAREFMARGLPFISAVYDPALPKEQSFFWRVTNDETPIDMTEIVAFAKIVKADQALPDAMRDYAEQHLSWQSVFAKIIERVHP